MKKLSFLTAFLMLLFTFTAVTGQAADLKKKTSGKSSTEALEAARKKIPEYKIPRVDKFLKKFNLPEYKIPRVD